VLSTRLEGVPQDIGQGESILRGRSKFRLVPFLGPAFIAAIAYIDPGNFATNIAAGSQFGYTLLWVIVASNLMAMLIQTLSAKLGIATGKNLPEVCRESFSRRTSVLLWVQAEVIAMATDLAEFLGAALGFNLLFGIDLFPAAILTAIAAFGILGLQRFGFRPFEATIAGMIGVIGVCYVIEMFFANPPLLTVAKHAVLPEFQGTESILLAVGILGATVMPHVIYLHSSLTQSRIVPQTDAEAKKLLRYTRVDVIVAMSIAGLINMAMLVMAASTFFDKGLRHVGSIESAHRTLEPLLGSASAAIFAIALIGSGLSSSAIGTLAGQVVMQGFIRKQIPIWVRRIVTMAPAFIAIGLGVNPSRTLVISQVVLSFGIPFALVPLVMFTSRGKLMGVLVNERKTAVAAWIVAGLIIFLNLFLLWQTFFG
jgi:manganese transport protein